ncbi:1-phosphatidylinositol-3-phosphate 5-kinase FAB1A-like [Panicum miliaceum]|uniref:1-phosphatidylinositol-3-phosphate 5-kinase n=1 Tax=Panicum miliaceum TaxID=4540 RepID=A0A3L6TCV1_PANMI|nr:1-phosphatidylinositol-3-phosphate 5-kinase FAB1A-like [Panicum miliaceum]
MDEVNIDLTCSTSCCKMSDHGEGSSIVTGDSLTDSDFEEEIEIQDTGQSYPDTLLSDYLMEQGEGSLIRVEECQLRNIAVVDDCATVPIPADQNISSGHPESETLEDSIKGKFDDTNITSCLNLSSEQHQDVLSNNQSIETKCGVSVEDFDLKQSGVIDVEEVTSLPMPGGDIIPLNEQVMDQLDGSMENTIVYNNISNTEPDMKHGDDLDNENECLYPLVLPSFDADPLIWSPPAPENMEDDFDTVSNNSDESENNSSGWARSSFNVNLAERSKESHEDQLQKVMSEVMNGQFKILVSRFLAAEGFSISDGGTEKKWLDIVASLSWDASLLVKPDANSGNAMDPGLYVKVKCIPSGSYQQSEVVNGLVFKKSAAHKQMRANGALGHFSTGLASINSMKQENEQLEKTLSEVIGKCQPNVILVEKVVSRNVKEHVQKQGVTVVSDMNMRRLERIARCTGSSIVSLQNVLTKPTIIKQCESLHFEKFVEEHNITGEDGRKSWKTFLFLEGFPRPLGCTVLLKGAAREELKKIKCVLHFTVFAAYHLILETSFFADQKLFTTDKPTTGKEKCFKTNARLLGPCYDSSENSDTMKHPTCDYQYANQEKLIHTEKPILLHLHDNKTMTSEDPAGEKHIDSKGIRSCSSLPVSVPSTNFMQDSPSSDYAESNACDGFDGSIFMDTSKEVHKKQLSGEKFQETANGICAESGASLNTQDILISMSSQHIRNQAVCEQSHLSRITYYGYFDTSLGRYLQDTLLNEKHSCLSCGESPEAHMYSYTHHNGALTVLVKRLPVELSLSGEAQGRIWMWTRCLRCNAKPTNRVIISSSARNLSFGKFLELSFSTHSAAKKLSTCGHLLHRDCLRFFGFGSRVAMFIYSSVEIYSACKPSLTLEFNNRNKKDWLDVEVNNVGFCNIFAAAAAYFPSANHTYLDANIVLFFKVSLKAFNQVAIPEIFAHEILGLNWLYQQLLLGFYIWDLRLLHILQYTKVNTVSSDNSIHERTVKNELKNSGSIAIQDTPLMKNIGIERNEATISSSSSFDDSCSNKILDKAQLIDKLIIKEHELPVYQDHDARSSLSSPGEAIENGSHQFEATVEIANEFCSEKSPFTNHEQPAVSKVNEIYHVVIPSDDAGKWVWNRFSHLELEYKKELQGGSLYKFHLINKYTPCSSSLTQLKHQMDLGHFIVGRGGNILPIAEEEVSSIIAVALTISEQQGFSSEVASSNLDRNASMLSSILASTISPEESTSGFYDSFLSALKDLHPEIDLNNEKIALRNKYTVVCIYAKQFHDLRKICCPSELAYISLISRCKHWDAQGGKSKVFFAKSMDDRFIIKQIKKTEFDSFLKFGLEYFKHFGVSEVSNNPTCLAKILGIYQVKETRNGKETRTNFMVMENLLFGHNILRRYDLKNFIEDMRTMPIYIEGKTKNLMERAIWNDTAFLSNMNVMDYSLFVGVEKQKKELVFGIIDYLRQYTWDKQLESWVKTSLVVPKNLLPTVISPREYKIRFRAFMSQYFLSVPDA